VFSAVLTWALENAIDTANSMRARGYGIPGRTSFSLFTFGKTDGIALIVTLILGASAALGAWNGALDFTYYPAVSAPEPELADPAVWILIGVMMLLPAMIEIADRMLWNLYRSRM
jgi:energy-coupling factor transport system permease protein